MPRALGYLAQCHLRFGPLRGTAPHSTASRFANTHRLLHLALAEGGPAQQAVLKEDLLAAYFLRAENVADQDVLRRTADKAGLRTARVDQVLERAWSEPRESTG